MPSVSLNVKIWVMTSPLGRELHSIARILYHTHFWQEAEIARATGRPYPKPEHLDDTFASIEPGT